MMTHDELRTIATEYRAGLLGKRSSANMCFAVSIALKGYLSFHTVETTLTEGRVGGYSHFWLTLPDGTIIDPTADQFATPDGDAMPGVYVGTLPEWYSEKEYAW